MTTDGLGPLAAALAKAQSAFGPVTKDKTVTVTTKMGGSYKFSYAPLDQILGVVREPLSKNGLVVVQLLDTDALVTMLIHDSGASLEARTPLPSSNDIQGYGSAITYLRRYAIQAMLGIAAEDDDDANRAAGNQAVPKVDPKAAFSPPDVHEPGVLVGIIEATKDNPDFEPTTNPEGFALEFKLRGQGRGGGIKVVAHSPIAEDLADLGKDVVVGSRVSCWGRVKDESFTNKANRTITYQVLELERITGPFGQLPKANPDGVSPLREDTIPVAEGQESFDLVESARLDAEEAAAAS